MTAKVVNELTMRVSAGYLVAIGSSHILQPDRPLFAERARCRVFL